MPNKTEAVLKKIILAVSIIMVVFQFYTAAVKPFPSMVQRPVHFMLALTILWLYEAMGQKKFIMRLINYVLIIISVAVNLYITINWVELSYRTTTMTMLDITVSIAIIVLVLISTWRSAGFWMMFCGLIFLAYAYWGPMLPNIFRFKGISLMRALASIVMSSEGIYGSTLAVSATFVFMFILFGDFLFHYGAGQFIIDLANSVLGRFRGGSPKVAILASGLFGMVSGSGTANVVGTGTFTIPLIKKAGYSPEFAGGIASSAATGGLLMPPVMGAAAFLMADFLQIPYGQLCIYAAIPAIFYFAGLFFVADLRSIRIGDLGRPKDQLPSGKEVLKKGWHYLICIIVLVIFLVVLRWSASKACVLSIVALLISDYARRLFEHDKIKWSEEKEKLIKICLSSCKGCLVVATSCACAGIIVGVFSATGLSLRFSSLIVELAAGSQIVLLVLAMIGALILGMGMPSISVYILMAIIVAPALTKMGISALAAHMFLLYFGNLAPITPPSGTVYFAASSIAKSKIQTTGFVAWRLSLPGYILPFFFVYAPAIMLQGTPLEVLWVCFYCAVGLLGMTFAFEGNIGNRLVSKVLRVPMGVFAAMTVIPELYSTLIGLAGLAALFAIVMVRGERVQLAPQVNGLAHGLMQNN